MSLLYSFARDAIIKDDGIRRYIRLLQMHHTNTNSYHEGVDMDEAAC